MVELSLELPKELLKNIKAGVASPALLNVARQLLKDNDFQSTHENNPELLQLAKDLPFDEVRESA